MGEQLGEQIDRHRGQAEVIGQRIMSRRSFGRRAAVAAPAVVGGTMLGGLIGPAPAGAATTASWSTTGNAGSSPTTNFLGTTDNQPLVVRTNNVERLRVLSSGNVGIGTAAPTAKLQATSTTALAGLFAHTATTGATPALSATTASTDAAATAVLGTATATASGAVSAGVHGANAGTASGGYGVWGSHAGSGYGVLGTASTNGSGVGGIAIGTGIGMAGLNYLGTGPGGKFTGNLLGLNAIAQDSTGTAVLAQNTSAGDGVAVKAYAASGDGFRVHPGGGFFDAAGEFCGANGVIGAASTAASDGYGVVGIANNTLGIGVAASSSGGAKALVSFGDADIFGTLTKSGGSFRIDHPLSPADKFLSHSFVESPDMKNVYDGVVTTDTDGTATVEMPDWFDALNRDFRYQLTPIGGPAPDLHIAATMVDGRFGIAGARPGQQISWQVTGIRQDAWANANRIQVEQDKPAADKGRYVHPELAGAPSTTQIGARQR